MTVALGSTLSSTLTAKQLLHRQHPAQAPAHGAPELLHPWTPQSGGARVAASAGQGQHQLAPPAAACVRVMCRSRALADGVKPPQPRLACRGRVWCGVVWCDVAWINWPTMSRGMVVGRGGGSTQPLPAADSRPQQSRHGSHAAAGGATAACLTPAQPRTPATHPSLAARDLSGCWCTMDGAAHPGS